MSTAQLPNVYRPVKSHWFSVTVVLLRFIFWIGTIASLICLSAIGGMRFGAWTMRSIRTSYEEMIDEAKKINDVDTSLPAPPVKWPDNFDPRDADGVYPDA